MKHQFPSATPALILLAVLLAAATPVTAADADRPLTGNQAASVAPAAPTPSPGAAPTLEDQSWLLAAYRVGNALVETTEGPRPARFRFEAGRVSGNAGCNQIGGAYTLAGTSLTFKANMAATMMACPEPLMRQDQAVGLALTGRRLPPGRRAVGVAGRCGRTPAALPAAQTGPAGGTGVAVARLQQWQTRHQFGP